jgi:hypothetical protein
MPAVAVPKIVLLSQKDPNKEVELAPEEGPFESWLAVAQDMWGVGNLTPLDSVFASRAIGAMPPSQSSAFGVVCYQLGHRLFTFSREGGIWIDAFEGEHALSRMEKRPKDKVKFAKWTPGKKQLGNSRLTHLAMLSPSRLDGPHNELVNDAARAMKKDGSVFVADLMQKREGVELPGLPKMHSPDEYRSWLDAAGLKFYNEHDMTGDVRVALLCGLHHSLNMLANARKLRDPWRSQRLHAFQQELETTVALHLAMDRGDVAAIGLLYNKN